MTDTDLPDFGTLEVVEDKPEQITLAPTDYALVLSKDGVKLYISDTDEEAETTPQDAAIFTFAWLMSGGEEATMVLASLINHVSMLVGEFEANAGAQE